MRSALKTIEAWWGRNTRPISLGDRAPRAKLQRAGGEGSFDLGEPGEHVLLTFLLGDWCPLCHIVMRHYMQWADELTAHGVKVVGVVPSAEVFSDALDPRFELLSDPECRVTRSFTNIELGDEAGRRSALPESFLIDRAGVVRWGSALGRARTGFAPEVLRIAEHAWAPRR